MGEAMSWAPQWDRLNHNWIGTPRGGYAVCANCDCQENSSDAANVCWEGPTVEKLRDQVRIGLRAKREQIPKWMRKVMDDIDAEHKARSPKQESDCDG
jgi:hypothetical protein